MLFALLVTTVLIIVVALIAVALIAPSAIYGEHDGQVVTINTDLCLESEDLTCFGQNPQSPYGRPIFRGRDNLIYFRPRNQDELEILLLQVREMKTNEAIAIYGSVPRGYLYWGVTGYLYDKPVDGQQAVVFASLADSVSTGSVPKRATAFAAVMTTNPALYLRVKVDLEKTWAAKSAEPIHVQPIFITADMYGPGYRYAIITRTALYNMTDPLPTYNARLYRYADLPSLVSPTTFFKPRSDQPKEEELLSSVRWNVEARRLIGDKYNIIQEIPTTIFLGNQVPGGLNYGWQCLYLDDGTPREAPLNCRGDNRDSTYIVSNVFQVEKMKTSIAVVAVDHTLTNRATYSSISFYTVAKEYGYLSTITGDTPIGPEAEKKIVARIIVNNPDDSYFDADGLLNVAATERMYVQPESGVGPSPTSILRFKAFIISYTPDEVSSVQLVPSTSVVT